MIHLPPLITDLCLILAAAGLITIIFKKIKQPVVLGYIIAGILVGPHFNLFPTVTEEESIKTWAEIGVIFLLFTLGLEFSFKKLAKVGGPASITAVVEVIFMLGIGFVTGKVLGWSVMDSIFLGGILSISSTTIIIRAFEELGVKTQKYAGLVFGVLIVEDLVAILLLVLLSTLAVSQHFSGVEMLSSVVKLVFFLILWFLGGIFLIPTFLKKTRKLMNDETLLIVSLALCLLMVLLATKVGFSPALGAFIMGSILAETIHAEHIEHLVKSVKDLFGAVFFVSVGMLINPEMIVTHMWPIVLITIVTVVGKMISTTSGSLISGQSLKTSLQSGMSLSQIGEFSFIIATLGMTLNVTSDFLYPIAVSVSVITTFTTPYLIRYSGSFYEFIESKLPQRWVKNLNSYSSTAQVITVTDEWKLILRAYVVNIVIQSVIILSIIFLAVKYLHPFITESVSAGFKGELLTSIIAIVVMAPFIWALSVRRIEEKAYTSLWNNRKLSHGPLIGMDIARMALGIFYMTFLILQFFTEFLFEVIAFAILANAIIYFSTRFQSFYNKMEKRFLTNLNERESRESIKPNIVPWDAHLVELTVAPEASIVGQSLQELAIREKYGVNIAQIERGQLTIVNPGRDEKLYPYDKLLVIGTDDQLVHLKSMLEVVQSDPSASSEKELIRLQKIDITIQSSLKDVTIRSSGIREEAHALVVGIERNRKRILNPESTMKFEAGDIVWIVGNPKRLNSFLQSRKTTSVNGTS